MSLFQVFKESIDILFDPGLGLVAKKVDRNHIFKQAGADTALDTADLVFVENCSDAWVVINNIPDFSAADTLMKFHGVCS